MSSDVAHPQMYPVGSSRPPGDLAVGEAEGVRFPEARGLPRTKLGISDLGDHRATRAVTAPERLPACAAGLPPRPRSRSSASLHAGLLAFGVPPRTERPPQAGRGMGMPRPAISVDLTRFARVIATTGRARHARVCASEISRGRIDRFDIPSPLCARGITARAVHRRRLLRDGAGF